MALVTATDDLPGEDERLPADCEFTDEELTDLALAADPDQAPDPEAVPFSIYPGSGLGLLPLFYMPPVTATSMRRWWTPVVILIIVAFLAIDVVGLCMTYGVITVA